MIDNISRYIIDPLIVLLVAVATVVFLWGVVEFIAGADNPAKRETGKQHLIWGIIGLTIIVSVFGIIRLLQATVLQILG